MTLDPMTTTLAASLRSVRRRIAEIEMRSSARAAGIEKLYQMGENSSDAEAALYDDLDALVLLRVQQWTLQGMLYDAGAPTGEDLSIIQTKIAEIEQLRGALEEPPENHAEIVSFRTVTHLMRELDETLSVLRKSQYRSGSVQRSNLSS